MADPDPPGSDDDDAPDPPIFELELQAFLEDRLDQLVHLGSIPQESARPDDGSDVVLTVVGSQTPLLLSGPAGATFWRIQLDCYAGSPGQAARTSEVIRQFLQPYRGPMGRLFLKNAVLLTRPGGFDPRGQGQDDGTYRRMSEWTLCVRESIPS